MSDEKAAIARAVAADIPDHSSVFIDIGTTAEAVAAALMVRNGLRVVSNNINVVSMLAKKEDFELVVCVASVANRDLAVVGQTTTEFIGRFHVDYAIIGVVAIAPMAASLDFAVDERRRRGDHRLRDSSTRGRHRTKFGRHAMARVAHRRRDGDPPMPCPIRHGRGSDRSRRHARFARGASNGDARTDAS